MLERGSRGKPDIKVLRPKAVVDRELKELAKQYWEAKPGSIKGLVDDLGALLHEVSGGRFGKPSTFSRMTSTFEEANDIFIAEASLALTELRDKYEKPTK